MLWTVNGNHKFNIAAIEHETTGGKWFGGREQSHVKTTGVKSARKLWNWSTKLL